MLRRFSWKTIIAEETLLLLFPRWIHKTISCKRYRKQGAWKRCDRRRHKEDDFIEHMFIASTHQYILFFTDKGRVYCLRCTRFQRVQSCTRKIYLKYSSKRKRRINNGFLLLLKNSVMTNLNNGYRTWNGKENSSICLWKCS